MKDQLEKVFDSIAASTVPEPQDYTDSETGLLHCGNCHTPKQCRVTLFGKEKHMLCTCRCRQEHLAAEEQARKEQQRLDRIRRLKANGLQDKALLAYTFDKADGDNPALKCQGRIFSDLFGVQPKTGNEHFGYKAIAYSYQLWLRRR